MTELVNLSPGFHGFEICCHKQLKFRDKIFSVMGSMSGAGLSLSCICGYCGSSHQIKIDYPEWQQYVKGEEACVEKQVECVGKSDCGCTEFDCWSKEWKDDPDKLRAQLSLAVEWANDWMQHDERDQFLTFINDNDLIQNLIADNGIYTCGQCGGENIDDALIQPETVPENGLCSCYEGE